MAETPLPAAETAPTPPTQPPAKTVNIPLGRPGYEHAGGYVYEEKVPELIGLNGRKVLRQMRRYSPLIRQVYLRLLRMIQRATWTTVAADLNDPAAVAAQDLLRTSMADMRDEEGNPIPWSGVLGDLFTAMTFGFAPCEVSYKRRRPPESDYDDGRIGWASIDLRGQLTVERWELSPSGAMRGLWQRAAPDYALRYIPADRILNWRPIDDNGSPEGESPLLAVWRPWQRYNRVWNLACVGFERTAAGLPIARIPNECLTAQSGPEKATADAFYRLTTNIRTDNQQGIVIPSDKYPDGTPMFDVQLMSTAASKGIDPTPLLDRIREDMAIGLDGVMTLIGLGTNGSLALAKSVTETWKQGIEGLMDSMAETLNDGARRLQILNRIPANAHARFAHGPVAEVDLADLAAFLTASGLDVSDDAAQAHLRQRAGLPPADAQDRAL